MEVTVFQCTKLQWPLTRCTIVDVCFTSRPTESSSTGAHESPECVSAGPTVLAGIGDAFIYINVAQLTWRMQNKMK